MFYFSKDDLIFFWQADKVKADHLDSIEADVFPVWSFPRM